MSLPYLDPSFRTDNPFRYNLSQDLKVPDNPILTIVTDAIERFVPENADPKYTLKRSRKVEIVRSDSSHALTTQKVSGIQQDRSTEFISLKDYKAYLATSGHADASSTTFALFFSLNELVQDEETAYISLENILHFFESLKGGFKTAESIYVKGVLNSVINLIVSGDLTEVPDKTVEGILFLLSHVDDSFPFPLVSLLLKFLYERRQLHLLPSGYNFGGVINKFYITSQSSNSPATLNPSEHNPIIAVCLHQLRFLVHYTPNMHTSRFIQHHEAFVLLSCFAKLLYIDTPFLQGDSILLANFIFNMGQELCVWLEANKMLSMFQFNTRVKIDVELLHSTVIEAIYTFLISNFSYTITDQQNEILLRLLSFKTKGKHLLPNLYMVDEIVFAKGLRVYGEHKGLECIVLNSIDRILTQRTSLHLSVDLVMQQETDHVPIATEAPGRIKLIQLSRYLHAINNSTRLNQVLHLPSKAKELLYKKCVEEFNEYLVPSTLETFYQALNTVLAYGVVTFLKGAPEELNKDINTLLEKTLRTIETSTEEITYKECGYFLSALGLLLRNCGNSLSDNFYRLIKSLFNKLTYPDINELDEDKDEVIESYKMQIFGIEMFALSKGAGIVFQEEDNRADLYNTLVDLISTNACPSRLKQQIITILGILAEKRIRTSRLNGALLVDIVVNYQFSISSQHNIFYYLNTILKCIKYTLTAEQKQGIECLVMNVVHFMKHYTVVESADMLQAIEGLLGDKTSEQISQIKSSLRGRLTQHVLKNKRPRS